MASMWRTASVPIRNLHDTHRHRPWPGDAMAGLLCGQRPAEGARRRRGRSARGEHRRHAWILVSTALVMLMTPGLAFFYGGLVRTKNVLSTIMHSWFILALVSVTWVAFGYTLAFGPSQGGLIGGLDHLFLRGVGTEPGSYATTIPSLLFVVYQMMFAIITPALISGAFDERKSFTAFVVFASSGRPSSTCPLSLGLERRRLALQAGRARLRPRHGVHISSGVAALVAALYLGRRIRAESERFEPHNVTYVVLGGALLWFGWVRL